MRSKAHTVIDPNMFIRTNNCMCHAAMLEPY
jgi:hypothetical protein